MPGELPEGCDYSAWARLRDEWRLAARIPVCQADVRHLR
jgi:hypothetical protein